MKRRADSKRYTKKMLLAWKHTVRAYEKLIKTGDTSGWQHYQITHACRLCKAAGLADWRDHMCKRCVLGPESDGCSHSTMRNLRAAIDGFPSFDPKKRAAARLAWMKRKVAKNLKRKGQTDEV